MPPASRREAETTRDVGHTRRHRERTRSAPSAIIAASQQSEGATAERDERPDRCGHGHGHGHPAGARHPGDVEGPCGGSVGHRQDHGVRPGGHRDHDGGGGQGLRSDRAAGPQGRTAHGPVHSARAGGNGGGGSPGRSGRERGDGGQGGRHRRERRGGHPHAVGAVRGAARERPHADQPLPGAYDAGGHGCGAGLHSHWRQRAELQHGDSLRERVRRHRPGVRDDPPGRGGRGRVRRSGSADMPHRRQRVQRLRRALQAQRRSQGRQPPVRRAA